MFCVEDMKRSQGSVVTVETVEDAKDDEQKGKELKLTKAITIAAQNQQFCWNADCPCRLLSAHHRNHRKAKTAIQST